MLNERDPCRAGSWDGPRVLGAVELQCGGLELRYRLVVDGSLQYRQHVFKPLQVL